MTTETYRYRAMLRPVSFCTLPMDMPAWQFAHQPGTIEGGPYGVIETAEPLSADDRYHFDLKLV